MKAIPTDVIERKPKKITFEDYLLMPEITPPYEILDGELIMYAAPTPAHQKISWNLAMPLGAYVYRNNLGVVLYAPVDIIVQRDPLRTRQPDVLFIHKDKLPGTRLADLEELQPLEMAPDLAIEILSPSETKKKLSGKLADYRRMGVKECWLVSRESRSVEVLGLTVKKSKRLGVFGLGETIRSQVLPDFQLAVDTIFI